MRVNGSVDYAYLHHRLSLSGETAMNELGAVATINTLSYQSEGSLRVVALQRFYSYRYTTLHGHALNEGGKTQNEQGYYLGASWQPFVKLQLKCYADIAYFPWARYRVSQSSWSQDYVGEVMYLPWKAWTIKARYRLRLRQMDNTAKTALRRHNEHRGRLTLGYDAKWWNTTTQFDAVRTANYAIEQGWMLGQKLSMKHAWWQLSVHGAYFHTDGYDSRLYTYERQLPHEFSFSMFYGRGMRLALIGRAKIDSALQFDMKIGHTHYYDRQTIGSGLQQINSNRLTDLDLQARWKF